MRGREVALRGAAGLGLLGLVGLGMTGNLPWQEQTGHTNESAESAHSLAVSIADLALQAAAEKPRDEGLDITEGQSVLGKGTNRSVAIREYIFSRTVDDPDAKDQKSTLNYQGTLQLARSSGVSISDADPKSLNKDDVNELRMSKWSCQAERGTCQAVATISINRVGEEWAVFYHPLSEAERRSRKNSGSPERAANRIWKYLLEGPADPK